MTDPTLERWVGAIRDIAAQHLAPGSKGPFRAEARLREDLGLDSLQAMTLAVEVENRFKIRIPPEVEAEIRTVGDLARVVAALVAQSEPPAAPESST